MEPAQQRYQTHRGGAPVSYIDQVTGNGTTKHQKKFSDQIPTNKQNGRVGSFADIDIKNIDKETEERLS